MQHLTAPKSQVEAIKHPTRHVPDNEVCRICAEAYIQDMKGIYNELERYNERLEMLSEPLSAVNYTDMLGIMTSCKGERETGRIEALESLRQSISSIEGEYNDFIALLDTLEFGAYIWQHYFLNLPWGVIACRERVERKTIWRRKTDTLRELYIIMPEIYRRFTIPNAINF